MTTTHFRMGGALGRRVAGVQATRQATLAPGHPQVGTPGVEDDLERLRWRADLHLTGSGVTDGNEVGASGIKLTRGSR